MSSPPLYERGDTIREILHQRTLPDKDFRVWLEDLGLLQTPEAYDLSTEEERLRSALMVQAGQGLDRRLDDLLSDIYACGDAFYDLRSRRRLKRLHDELDACREEVRSFEIDVEESALLLSTDEAVLPAHFEPVMLVLDNVKRTLDRAYDLCLYKRKKIADGWVTATNLLISLVILLVTVIWWMESAPIR
jgi:hypothetical protein